MTIQATIEIHPDDRVAVLTGAGISAESGLKTFRDSDGLWAGHKVETVATPEAWDANPELVWQFYSQRRIECLASHPNPAHDALAQLEQKIGGRLFLCSQNVDDLHERSGSRDMVHMHGELFKSRCEANCGARVIEDRKSYNSMAEIPRCGCGARLRPHIVWFGEIPLEMTRISRETRSLLRPRCCGHLRRSASGRKLCPLGNHARRESRSNILCWSGSASQCRSLHRNNLRQGGREITRHIPRSVNRRSLQNQTNSCCDIASAGLHALRRVSVYPQKSRQPSFSTILPSAVMKSRRSLSITSLWTAAEIFEARWI